MDTARHHRADGSPPPVVVCIAAAPEERSRLAGLFDGVGVMVLAADPGSASSFLGHLHDSRGGRDVQADTGWSLESVADPPDTSATVVRVGALHLDLVHHEATWHGQSLQLTPRELAVLGCLARRPGRVWTYEQLYGHGWDGAYFPGPAAVQSVVKRLRAKLRMAGLPFEIVAVRGLGFRLAEGRDLRLVSAKGQNG
ncbi:winged helix-turn-helix domain-containing protein [Actinopolymorpha alba]|uniref:winged helix-turn-helix domain-containing protein n=1 Tax=Actinopolymorpha alba TaxID=533267 RepID=UPI000366F121|nr:winged helix-turn-helix domain-containing protein [Actinopolymorpha alba]